MRVRAVAKDTKDFHINMSLYQGSSLSPFLFTIILDELTKDIQHEVPITILYGNTCIS